MEQLKKIGLLTGVSLLCAVIIDGAAIWLLRMEHWQTAVMFYLLSGLLLGLYGFSGWFSKRFSSSALLVYGVSIGGAALWTALGVLLIKLLAGGFLLRGYGMLLFVLKILYPTLLLVQLFVGIMTKRQKPMIQFTRMNTPSGIRQVHRNKIARVLYTLALLAGCGPLLQFYMDNHPWALAALIVWFIAVQVMYLQYVNSSNIALLADRLDPAAYYDVLVDLYEQMLKRRQQNAVLLNMIAAYGDLDQTDVCRQLAQKLQTEPLSPVQQLILGVQQASLTETLPEFEQKEQLCKGMMLTVKNKKMIEQTGVLLAGHRARLEQHPQGMLWYADQIDSLPGLKNRRNHLVAQLYRAESAFLTGDLETAKALVSWTQANCGGCITVAKDAAQLKARLTNNAEV